LLKPNAQMVCLIKPQFEAGKEKVGKKGVVREPQVHKEVIETVFAFTLEKGFKILNLDFSPIRGPEGNIEYLMHLIRVDQAAANFDFVSYVQDNFAGLIRETVDLAHRTLDVK
ncbi:MAG: TlyA family RNA methyltransferase, partial [Lachnospiraceae bacterium]|nr:TlyA family RNA methyltransferase [Lachnospiraceae bacterium]